MILIQKIDGPKSDPILNGACEVVGQYQGIVIGTEADLVDGDYARVTETNDAGKVVSISEHRWTVQPEPVTPVQSWDAYDFKLRFTADERKAIRTAAKASPDVEDFLDMLDTAAATGTRIKADDALLNAGLQMMESAELIGAGRAAEIIGA